MRLALLLLAPLLLLGSPACVPERRGPAPSAPDLADAPLPEDAGALLDLAWRAASALPLDPHVKTRSRLQEEVVRACLELDQPGRARAWLAGIANWRRGVACAELALHAAARGQADRAREWTQRALDVAEEAQRGLAAQEWRAERVRARTEFVRDVLAHGPWETRPIDLATEEAAVARAFAAGDLDAVRDALARVAWLYRRLWADESARGRLEALGTQVLKTAPPRLACEHLLLLGEADAAAGDPARALERAGSVLLRLVEGTWLPEDRIAMLGSAAGLQARAGDLEGARGTGMRARLEYERERFRIADVWRAGALRPLAEAMHRMDGAEEAWRMWRLVLAEGGTNPNSRPRAEDLVATALALARVGGRVPADVLQEITMRVEALGPPW